MDAAQRRKIQNRDAQRRFRNKSAARAIVDMSSVERAASTGGTRLRPRERPAGGDGAGNAVYGLTPPVPWPSMDLTPSINASHLPGHARPPIPHSLSANSQASHHLPTSRVDNSDTAHTAPILDPHFSDVERQQGNTVINSYEPLHTLYPATMSYPILPLDQRHYESNTLPTSSSGVLDISQQLLEHDSETNDIWGDTLDLVQPAHENPGEIFDFFDGSSASETAQTRDQNPLEGNGDRHKGENTSSSKEYQQSALHIAAERGHTPLVEMFLAGGVEVDERDSDDNTALHAAIYQNNLSVALRLLQYKADPNAANSTGWTPVHFAVLNGSQQAVKMLIQYGGDLTIKARGRHFCRSGKAIEPL